MSADLTPVDLALHARLMIPPNLLAAASVRRVTDREARDLLGVQHRGDLAGILYPRLDPVSGREVGYRVRRDHPEMEACRPRAKYMAGIDRQHLYFPPGAAALLANVSVPVVFVEAEKSALALTAGAERTGRELLPIGLGGCWGWKGRIGKTMDADGARVDEYGPLPDLNLVTWRDRNIVIMFDANAATNASVTAARRALAKELTDRGARVRIGELPIEDGINGPDDYIGKYADAALFALLDAAKPARRSQDLPIADLLSEFHLTAEAVRDITPDVLDGRLRALGVALTGADRLRKALVAAELKKTAKLPAAIVTAAFDTRDDEPDKTASHTITLPDDEPAPETVNGAALLDETAALIRRHVVMTEAQADAGALWTGAAYAVDGLQRMPMLLLSSNAPECGKTTAATLFSGIVPRPVMVSNLTPAVLFRLLDRYQPTLIADEVDSWLNDEKSELRGVFNAAHWRTGAMIPRCVGDDHDVRLFNVFGAKVIAMIGRPPTTMLSRSITIALHRRLASEVVEPLREDPLRADLAPLRRRWRRWTLDHLEALRGHNPAMPADLPVNRASDNWRPLLSIADLAGGSWPARARAAALALSGVRASEDEPINVALLADVQAAFRERGEPEYLSSEEIIVTLKALSERPWADWNKGRGISAAQLAHRIRGFDTGPLGLRTRKTRLDATKTAQRWHRADFTDAWSRYVTADLEHPEQFNRTGPQPAISGPEQSAVVPVHKMPVQPMFTGLVPGVPASEPDPGEAEQEDRWTL